MEEAGNREHDASIIHDIIEKCQYLSPNLFSHLESALMQPAYEADKKWLIHRQELSTIFFVLKI